MALQGGRRLPAGAKQGHLWYSWACLHVLPVVLLAVLQQVEDRVQEVVWQAGPARRPQLHLLQCLHQVHLLGAARPHERRYLLLLPAPWYGGEPQPRRPQGLGLIRHQQAVFVAIPALCWCQACGGAAPPLIACRHAKCHLGAPKPLRAGPGSGHQQRGSCTCTRLGFPAGWGRMLHLSPRSAGPHGRPPSLRNVHALQGRQTRRVLLSQKKPRVSGPGVQQRAAQAVCPSSGSACPSTQHAWQWCNPGPNPSHDMGRRDVGYSLHVSSPARAWLYPFMPISTSKGLVCQHIAFSDFASSLSTILA